MTTAANKTEIPSNIVASTPLGVPSILLRIRMLELGESITVPLGRTPMPNEGPRTAIVISRVPEITGKSPAATAAVSPEGPGAPPAQAPPNVPEVCSEWAVAPSDHAAISTCMDDFFPGANPYFVPNEVVKSETGEQLMEAARRIACVLAMHRIPGYESVRMYLEVHRPEDVDQWHRQYLEEPPPAHLDIPLRALHTLAIIADDDIIPSTARVAASQCGGMSPDEGYNLPDSRGPNRLKWDDAGNECYEALIDELVLQGAKRHMWPPSLFIQGYNALKTMDKVHCAVVIKAYLAAAAASKRLNDHEGSPVTLPGPGPYEDLEGGAYTSSDEVARFINIWMFYNSEMVVPPHYE